MYIFLLAGLVACTPEEESSGIGAVTPKGPDVPNLSLRTEPALRSQADAASKKLFVNGVRAFRIRDFDYGLSLFLDAQRRHSQSVGESSDAFIEGCIYYIGRCHEGMFRFDEAKENFDRVPRTSFYRPHAARRLVAISQDSDGDGYADAWEEAEGKNPLNPLSHP